ncbi:hypothetical protein K1T73_11585 [Roseovarius sp. SCSIO 43702]|nr:hypothetical protein K1T73_11585 [Roseovarius sp. SCSIO 43702]
MKAIAEYFRDLAADDRYFGAEPPTPDAEMLARIAEREIARRVEAHDADGRIHLRAADAEDTTPRDSAAMLPDGTDAAPRAADSSAMSLARDMAERVQTDDDTADDWTDPAPRRAAPASGTAESVADKLRRIRAVANPVSTAFAGGYSEDEHAQDFLAETAAELDEALAEDDAAELRDAPEVPAEDEAATDLRDDDEAEDEAAQADDSAPDDREDESLDDDAILAAVTSEPLAGQTPDEAETLDFDAMAYDDDIDAHDDIDALLGADVADAAAPAPAPEVETETSLDTAPEESVEETAEDIEDEIDDADEDAGSDEDTLAQLMADALGGETGADDTDTDTDTDTAQPLEARVVKMKRSEFEAVMAETGLARDDEDEAALSPEDEAELQRELAEVEAELAAAAQDDIDASGETEVAADDAEVASDHEDDDAETTHADDEWDEDEDETDHAVEASDPEADSARPAGSERLPRGADGAEADRMFREADTQLGDSEGTKRRSAIQHLRAAVAATRAEKKAGGDITKPADVAPYRLDLEQAVRPRRPVASGTARAERPATERPAPLRLVAEQRIDRPTEPVRPRRVSHSDLVAEAPAARNDDAASFADYAEQVGANSLTDLLEAAAAYLADVEGRDQFSRPMLMHKLREISDEGFSREDGLRSFGQLLRQGKLQKLKGGRFAVTPDTDFRQAG